MANFSPKVQKCCGIQFFLQYTPLRWDSPYAGLLGGGGSDSRVVLSGAWQTLSVRRVTYIQYFRLSSRTDV